MIKNIFTVILLLGVSFISTRAGSDCPPPVPVFVECPGDSQGNVRACIYDTVYLQVKAVHPNSEKCDAIRYHLESGPGQVDEKTGVWSYFCQEGDLCIFEVEISASIGQSGHRTEGEENCHFTVRIGSRTPSIRVNLSGSPTVFLTQAPGHWSVPLYVNDYYNCGYTLVIDSVTPDPTGELYLDENENIIFNPLIEDINKKFYLKVKAYNQQLESYLLLVFDTRTKVPVPEFRPYPDTIEVPYCSYRYYKFRAFDPEYGDSIGITYKIASGPGYISKSGVWSFYASESDTGKTFEVEIAALYANSVTSPYNNARFTVLVTGNVPPIFGTGNPCGEEIYFQNLTDTISFFVSDENDCDHHEYFFKEISPQPSGTIEVGERLQHKVDVLFNFAEPDRGKSFSIIFGMTDGHDTVYCDFIVNVDKAPYSFMIEKKQFALPGKYVDVNLYAKTSQDFGGFDFLIGYEKQALTFMGANTESSKLFIECGWEYFTYRFGPFSSVDSTVPSGQLRVVGMAETNNGNHHPSCFSLEENGVLFAMKFLVTNDDKYENLFIPIRFFWFDCTDNTIANRYGSELYIAEKVYDYLDGENWKLLTPDDVNMIHFPTYEGVMENCVYPGGANKPQISRNIDFYNGGIDIMGTCDPDMHGDLNLDGVAYTIADAVLFSEYFLKGLEVFGIYYEGSIAASDVNYDGIPLTVEDFVYNIRVISGDVEPEPDSVLTCPDTARFILNEGIVSVDFDSADSLGAVYLKILGEVTPVLEATSVYMRYHYDSTYTNIIIYSFEPGNAIHSGALVSGIGDNPLVEAATATYIGDKVISEIEMVSPQNISLRIDTKTDVIQGSFKDINVYLDSKIDLGGFDLLIGYNSSALTLSHISADSSALFNNCAWEYFTYRTGPFGRCDSTCPSGLVRVVGFADYNNGDVHPSCYNVDGENILFTLTFLVTNDRHYECTYMPVMFFWIDCMDNVLSNKSGQMLYVSNNIYNYSYSKVGSCTLWRKIKQDDTSNISFPTYAGVVDSCLYEGTLKQRNIFRSIDFYNGGIESICADSIDFAGDINIDGISYNYKDADLFRDYFLIGTEVFEPYVISSMAGSDVNHDGITLTIEDYQYLIRVMLCDLIHFDDLKLFDDTIRFTQNSGTISVDFDSADSLGAVYLKIQGEVTPVLEAASMDMRYHFDSTYTNIIIYSFESGKAIHSGALVSGIGNNILVEAATTTYYGAKVTSGYDYLLDVDDISDDLPNDFYLGINYPNPFNPATTIEYRLPYSSVVELVVYNVRGQRVKTLVNEKMSAGTHTTVWNGVDDDGQTVASGVYFYRLQTDKFTAAKKMVLMK